MILGKPLHDASKRTVRFETPARRARIRKIRCLQPNPALCRAQKAIGLVFPPEKPYRPETTNGNPEGFPLVTKPG